MYERSQTMTRLYRYGQMFFLSLLHLRVKIYIHLVFVTRVFICLFLVLLKYIIVFFVDPFLFGR